MARSLTDVKKVINPSGKNDRLITLYTYNKISTQATSEIINLSTDCVGQCSQVSEIKTKLLMSAILEVH